MKKREFIKLTGLAAAGVAMSPIISCGSPESTDKKVPAVAPEKKLSVSEFTLPKLGYAFDALQPSIDAKTMEIHHGKHHAGYVRKLNNALKDAKQFASQDLASIMKNVGKDDTGVRNNGGGHFNHSLFWSVMAPGGSNAPSGQLGDAINAAFGSVEEFNKEFFSAAKTRFGSGWAWLSVDKNNKLFVSSTPNQDNPAMTNIVEQSGTPILGIDVWEHAYYLNYQNKRGDYINAFTELINWDEVAQRFAGLM